MAFKLITFEAEQHHWTTEAWLSIVISARMARVFQKRKFFIPGPVLSPAFSAEQYGQVVDGDEVLVHGRLTELPVDHDPAGAGQV